MVLCGFSQTPLEDDVFYGFVKGIGKNLKTDSKALSRKLNAPKFKIKTRFLLKVDKTLNFDPNDI